MHLQSLIFFLAPALLRGYALDDLRCPPGNALTLTTSDDGSQVLLSNGFVCVQVGRGGILGAFADATGHGTYGETVGFDEKLGGVMGLEVQLSGGEIVSSLSSGIGGDPTTAEDDGSVVAMVSPTLVAGASNITFTENWTVTLGAGERSFMLDVEGSTTAVEPDDGILCLRRATNFAGASVYAWWAGGHVQMKDQLEGQGHFGSAQQLYRVYALGATGGDVDGGPNRAGNTSIDLDFLTNSDAETFTVVLNGADVMAGKGSGLLQVLAGASAYPEDNLDRWTAGWSISASTTGTAFAAAEWSASVRIGVNDRDFPTARLVKSDTGIPLDDLHGVMTGIYASPVGCLNTHVNAVADGEAVGQIATTIARPDYGYGGTYNYFDPDNFISTSAMLYSYEPYIQAEVRKVLERSGDFLLPNGQLPHHFEGTTPTYQALSGEIQTGPNVFWVLSCFTYAKTSGDLEWLQSYMPTLRNATNFLYDLIDDDLHLALVPGSLMIDVFLRWNYTTDTNAMLVGFFREFALAEDAVGNATGANDLRDLSNEIAQAINEHLWAAEDAGSDHYVTQWDGPELGTYRDFVDYDANMIAAAHGIPSEADASALFKRVDGGRCRASATFVSETWYGPNDTTDGNTGDSWCAMGRVAWFDANARKLYGDAAGFESHLLKPLQRELLSSTWLHERFSCDGTQQLNRTAMYFEYPSIVAMFLSNVKYGIDIQIDSVEITPFSTDEAPEFVWSMGTVTVAFSQQQVKVTAPRGLESTVRSTPFTISSLLPSTAYQVSVQGDIGGCTLAQGAMNETTDAVGVLRFTAPVGSSCTAVVSLL